MKRVWYIVSVILVLAGAVFFLQGMRVLPSQVMYGKPEWIVIGAGMVIVGVAIGASTKLRGAKLSKEDFVNRVESIVKLLTTILFAVGLGFGISLVILRLLPDVLVYFGYSASSLTIDGVLSATLAGTAIFSAGFLASQELSETTKSRHIDIADRLFDELNSKENIAARKWVYDNLKGDPATKIETFTDADREMVKRVLNSLDRVSFLTQKGWIDDDLVMPWMHPMIAKSWEKLEPFVIYERGRRAEPYYYFYAQQVSERCRKWRMNKGFEKPTNRVDKAI